MLLIMNDLIMTNFAGMFFALFQTTVSIRRHGHNYEENLPFKLS